MFLRILYVASMLVTLLIRWVVFMENYQEYKQKNDTDGPAPFEGEDADSEDDNRP